MRSTLGIAIALVAVSAVAAVPAHADTTIGGQVTGPEHDLGTCFGTPCVVVPTSLPSASQLTSPCEGSVSRFRINGVPTVNTYRLRVVHLSGSTATAVSASSPVSLSVDGVNTFATSLSIHAGDQLGLEFTDDTVGNTVRYRQPGNDLLFFSGIPDSGSQSTANTDSFLDYFFNADVACSTSAPVTPPPAATPKCKKKKKKVKREASAAKKKKKGCKKKKKRK
jgi:hypothetical protein